MVEKRPVEGGPVRCRLAFLSPRDELMDLPRVPKLLQQIRRLANGNGQSPRSDRDLVRRFLKTQDQTAFSSLVQRHGPMVLRVCQRMLSNDHDAEDAFQATFLVFVRKAKSLRSQDSVGSWLFGIAYRLSLKMRANAGKQKALESRADLKDAPEALTEITLREAQSVSRRNPARIITRSI